MARPRPYGFRALDEESDDNSELTPLHDDNDDLGYVIFIFK